MALEKAEEHRVPCAVVKRGNLHFKGMLQYARAVGYVISTDVCGPMQIISQREFKYFISFQKKNKTCFCVHDNTKIGALKFFRIFKNF